MLKNTQVIISTPHKKDLDRVIGILNLPFPGVISLAVLKSDNDEKVDYEFTSQAKNVVFMTGDDLFEGNLDSVLFSKIGEFMGVFSGYAGEIVYLILDNKVIMRFKRIADDSKIIYVEEE